MGGKLGLETYRPLLERLLALLQEQMGDDLLALCLYGSAARGQAEPTSDLDLLVVYRGDRLEAFDRFMQATRALEETPEWEALERRGILADPYPIFFSDERLATDTPWLLLDVQDHGIILYDRNGILARKLEQVRQRMKELGTTKHIMPDGSWYWDLKPDWKRGEIFEL